MRCDAVNNLPGNRQDRIALLFLLLVPFFFWCRTASETGKYDRKEEEEGSLRNSSELHNDVTVKEKMEEQENKNIGKKTINKISVFFLPQQKQALQE